MKTLSVRRDKNAVTIFNTKDGSKIRLGIGKYEKASRPELVDIKISDYCSMSCQFCYVGSTTEGQHGRFCDLVYIADELAKAKVFEVAIGGGEPTEFPAFISYLKYLREVGIVPNFTTKSAVWVRKNWKEIEDVIGAFAYSADSPDQLIQAARHFQQIPNDRINIHCVMGLQTEHQFVEYMALAKSLDLRVTLLGYKTTHRGATFEYFKLYNWWIEVIRYLISKDKCPTFSIDTTLAKQYHSELQQILPDYTYHVDEGKFSCYVDAVAMKLGASSYENLDQMVDFDENWLEAYQAF